MSPHISIVIQALGRGGTETQLLAVLPLLAAQGFTIKVHTLTGPGPLESAVRAKGIAVERVFSSFPVLERLPLALLGFLAVMRLAWRFRCQPPDIVHTYLPFAGLVGGLASRLSGCRRLVTSRRHRNERLRRYPVRGALERFINRRAQAVTGNSLRVIQDLESEGVEGDKVALIHNGVDPARFARAKHSAERAKLGLPPKALVMIIVANLVVHKGHRDVFAALNECRNKLKGDWRLLLAGRDDGMEVELRAMAGENGFSDHIVFLGEQENVAPLLVTADIGILASHEEGFSNAVLEGMAAGLPMIVTDVGGNPEAVLHEKCGLVVPPHAPEKLGLAIASLAADPALGRRFGKAARERVRARFTLERAANRQADLYRSLLDARNVPVNLRSSAEDSV